MNKPPVVYEVKGEGKNGPRLVHRFYRSDKVGEIAKRFAETAKDGESLTIVKRDNPND